MAHRKNRESTLFQPIDYAVIAVYQFSYVLVVGFRYNSTAFSKDFNPSTFLKIVFTQDGYVLDSGYTSV